MLNHKGTQTIYTERLILRKIREDDYKDMYRYTTKEEVAKYVTWSVHKSIEDTKAICKMWADEYKNGDKYHWAIVYNNRVIGNIEIVKIIDTTAMIGWQIDSEYWNKGIGSQLLKRLLDWAENNDFEIIELQVRSDNLGAIHLYEKYGFQKIGMHPAFFKIGNEHIPFYYMILEIK